MRGLGSARAQFRGSVCDCDCLRAKRIQKCSRGMLEVLRSVGAADNGTSCWDLLNKSFAQL